MKKVLIFSLALMLFAALALAGGEGVPFGDPFNQETYLFPTERIGTVDVFKTNGAAGKLEYNSKGLFCYSFKAKNEGISGPQLDTTGATGYALVFAETNNATVAYVLGLTEPKTFAKGKFEGETFLVLEGCCNALVGPILQALSFIRLVTVDSLEAKTDFDPNTFEPGTCSPAIFDGGQYYYNLNVVLRESTRVSLWID